MSGRIPQNFIDDLLARVDIVDVIDGYTTLKKTGKNYSGLCPFHNEKTPSFSVEPDKQFYYCFGCGAGGNAIGFVMNHDNVEFPEAIEKIAAQMGLTVPREESSMAQQSREKNQVLYDVLQQSAHYYQAQLRQHPDKHRAVDYLKNRGLSGEIARDFGLGYAPPGWNNLMDAVGTDESLKKALLNAGMLIENTDNNKYSLYDRFRDRIIYPIRDNRGRIIAFGGRVLGDDKPKYLNSPETPVFHKGEELYGLYEARKNTRKLERILIVEGYMDVIALAQHDISYAVATLGTATSTSHLRRLFKLVPEVVFCFDGDNAGREAAWRALEQVLPLMEDGRTARFLFLPEGEDPDTQVRKIGKDSFSKNIGSATQMAEFFFQTLRSRVDMNSLEGRAGLSKIALPYIKKIPEGIYHQLILEQLSSVTGVDLSTFKSLDKPNANNNSHFKESNRISIRATPVRKKQIERTACMKAVNLILFKPHIASKITIHQEKELTEIKIPGIELLMEVIELGKSFPNNSITELISIKLGTGIGDLLIDLANRERITPDEGVESEFSDIIAHFLKIHRKRQDHQTLLEQARQKLHSRHQGAGDAGENSTK